MRRCVQPSSVIRPGPPSAPPARIILVPLPRPADHDLPKGTTLVAIVPPEGLTLYRLVDAEVPTSRDFEERRTRAQAERDGIPEVFRLSVSHWLRHEQAAHHSIRRRFHVAE